MSSTHLNKTWDDLFPGFVNIYKDETSVSFTDYIQYYTLVYNFCTTTNIEEKGRRTGGSNSGAEFVGAELYEKIKGFLTDHVKILLGESVHLADNELLVKYHDIWKKYSFSSNVVNGICGYLNRNWIRREYDEGKNIVYTIYNLAILCWDHELFSHIADRLTTAILNLIEKERNGETINTGLVKTVLDSFLEIGINVKDDDAPRTTSGQVETNFRHRSHKIFRQKFEHRFIEDTRAYYTAEAKKFLENNSVVEFLKKVDKRLKQEQDRVDLYLDPQTMEPLMRACDDVLIANYLDRFRSEFDSMLENNQIEDLGRMFSLGKRVDGALEILRGIMEAHIDRKGKDAIAREKDTVMQDPKKYVAVILDVYEQFNTLVNSAFRNDPGFVQAMDKACTSFINRNAVAGTQHKSSNKSPELLARYSDMLLRKSAKNVSDNLEDALNQVMIVFKYLEDKDVFQKIYSKMLARRLVGEVSASEDHESSMLTKLKNMCGFEYTNKLQRMFTDNALSKGLTTSFKKHVQDEGIEMGLELSVMVLAQGVWPYAVTETCAVPRLLTSTFNQFTNYYLRNHQGRKLTLLPGLCRGELTTTCYGSTRYIFAASLPQMALILLYNDNTQYTIQSICDHLKISPESLVPIMQPMIKIDLLKTDSPIEAASPNTSQVVTLNLKFSSRKVRIDLAKAVQRTEIKKESNNLITKDDDEDRRLVIQATIVRIMKARKELSHTLLVGDVINQLQNRFKPKVPVIKKAIDTLIEKEYLQRKDGHMDVYSYLA